MTTSFLQRERETLEALLPGLDERLSGYALGELERPDNPGLTAFRERGGPGLLVPQAYGGAGANAVEAVRVQRAVGARSPSLAVATSMHHFSMASLVLLSQLPDAGMEWMLMEGIARSGTLLASGFAEGRPGASILAPTMTAVPVEGGVQVSGVKKPCSLARSMDLLTASVQLDDPAGGPPGFAVVMIPASSPGVSVSPFWGSRFLAGAESDQVRLDDAFVPAELVVRNEVAPDESIDALTVGGFVWFELLITASYIGAASALVERVLDQPFVPALERSRAYVEVEAAMAGIENVARQLADGSSGSRTLVDALVARYAAQDALGRVVPRAVELLGGRAFMDGDDVGYLAGCVQALGLHPPSRTKMADPLVSYLAGSPLTVA